VIASLHNQTLETIIDWATPWEPSPTLVTLFIIGVGLFWRGSRVHHVGAQRQWLFYLGVVMLYLCLHTRVDYYAERMFFIHRIQHLFLHHLAPFLVMLAYPGQVMRAGLPLSWRHRLRIFNQTAVGRWLIHWCTHPILIPFLFIFFVLIWLLPTPQFYSMIDWRLYRFMNWSVVISGFLYWNLILDRRPHPPAAMSPWGRVISPVITMTPQIAAGAYIAFTTQDLYPIFDLCGRAIPSISAIQDQAMGGLIMWVPAGLVETMGIVFALRTVLRLAAKDKIDPPRWLRPKTSFTA